MQPQGLPEAPHLLQSAIVSVLKFLIIFEQITSLVLPGESAPLAFTQRQSRAGLTSTEPGSPSGPVCRCTQRNGEFAAWLSSAPLLCSPPLPLLSPPAVSPRPSNSPCLAASLRTVPLSRLDAPGMSRGAYPLFQRPHSPFPTAAVEKHSTLVGL